MGSPVNPFVAKSKAAAFERRRIPSIATRDCTMPSSNRQDKMRHLCRHYGMINLVLTNNTGCNALMPLFMCARCPADVLKSPTGPLPPAPPRCSPPQRGAGQ